MGKEGGPGPGMFGKANLRTKILDFRGFDSREIMISRGGTLMPVGNLPEILSRRILVGVILKVGVILVGRWAWAPAGPCGRGPAR